MQDPLNEGNQAELEAAGVTPDEGKGKKESYARTLWLRFKADWREYCTIPVVAAFVGWFTNWLAVKMIFYPINFRGIPLRVIDDQPLGLIGWRGIVPAKAAKMSGAMVDMVTKNLIDVDQVFRQLDPRTCARLLAPEVDRIVPEVAAEVLGAGGAVRSMLWELISMLTLGAAPLAAPLVRRMVEGGFVAGVVRSMQSSIQGVLDIRESVVTTMLGDRNLLVKLFQTCGRNELRFLTDSGLWVGFSLGIVQMFAWLIYRRYWTLTLGGTIVGYLTNWIALKWIFEPVNPVKIGPITLQGMFLRRQKEVSAEFSDFFATRVLTSEKLWHSIFTGPKSDAFRGLVEGRVGDLLAKTGVGLAASGAVVKQIADGVVTRLPGSVHVLHDYVDGALDLKAKMGAAMTRMKPEQFERVLHPIFEEDELTLILAGAALGGAAGFIQQVMAQRSERRKKMADVPAKSAEELVATLNKDPSLNPNPNPNPNPNYNPNPYLDGL